MNGDGAFNQDVTKLLHPGTPGQYDRNDPDGAQFRTVGERPLQPTELYALGNPDYDSPGPIVDNPVRFTDPNEELARVGAEDDYWRRLEASTILGAGIDPDCLKPGGPAGGPNENRFDDRKYAAISDFARYSNPDTDEVTDLLGDSADGDSDTFQNATYGQCSASVTRSIPRSPTIRPISSSSTSPASPRWNRDRAVSLGVCVEPVRHLGRLPGG